MQDIEQNLEELFRKAAANYPLKVNGSQWDDIAPALLNKPVNTPDTKKTSSRKYIGLLLLFLSLLLNDGTITDTLRNNRTISFIPSSVKNETDNPIIANEAAGYLNNKKIEKKQAGQKLYFRQQISQPLTDYPLLFKKEIIQKQATKFKDNPAKSSLTPAPVDIHLNSFANTLTNTANAIVLAITPGTVASNKPVQEKDEPDPKENQSVIDKSIKKKQSSNQVGIYLGVLAGPLFDEVKNQGVKKTGFSVGIIAGYQFKKHLSVETGLLFAKKPYFSTGKYFSMDKISNSMPPDMQILSLEGNNFVLEIPARIKYDFLHRDKSNFFSTAGITSYIITREKNNYLVSMNGAQQTMTSSYKNKSRSLAATLDFSAGYTHKMGKTNHIRIEPYIQIPLKGMGVGSMPMISSGLRIGITKFTN